MRGLVAAVAVAVAASGVAATSSRPHRIAFGITGGNIVPFTVTLEPNGRIRHSGPRAPARHRLSHAEIASLSHLVRIDFAAGLASRRCPGTNPDVASGFIRALGRTVTVHGSCEPRFTKLWATLMRTVGLRVG
jgi:hypothetical protein